MMKKESEGFQKKILIISDSFPENLFGMFAYLLNYL